MLEAGASEADHRMVPLATLLLQEQQPREVFLRFGPSDLATPDIKPQQRSPLRCHRRLSAAHGRQRVSAKNRRIHINRHNQSHNYAAPRKAKTKGRLEKFSHLAKVNLYLLKLH